MGKSSIPALGGLTTRLPLDHLDLSTVSEFTELLRRWPEQSMACRNVRLQTSQPILEGDIDLFEKPGKFNLNVPGIDAVLGTLWYFRYTADENPPTLKDGFSSLLKQVDLDRKLPDFPDSVDLSALFLKSLEIGFEPTNPNATSMDFSIGVGKTWKIFDNRIVVDSCYLELRVSTFEPSKSIVFWDIELGGQCLFGNAKTKLDFTMRHRNDYSFDAKMAAGETFNLSDSLADLTGIVNLPQLIVNEFHLFASKNGDFSADVGVSQDWTIDIGTDQKLTILGSRFQFRSTGSQKSCFCFGEIKFGSNGPLLFLSGRFVKGAGWQFSAGVSSQDGISLSDLLSGLVESLGGSVPKSVPSLVLKEVNLKIDLTNKRLDFDAHLASSATVHFNEMEFHLDADSLISFSYESSTKAFTFDFETKLPLSDDQLLDAAIHVQNDVATGIVTIGTRKFELLFSHSADVSGLVASYSNANGENLPLHEFFSSISKEFADQIPQSLSVSLKDIYFVIQKTNSGKTFLFGLDLGADFSLSNLPLVGKQFPKDQNVGVENLQLVVASGDLTTEQVTSINGMLPDGIGKLPAAKSSPANSTADAGSTKTSVGLTKGLSLAATLQMGDKSQSLSLPVTPAKQDTASSSEPNTSAVVVSDDPTKWFEVNKSFGPVHFSRVGVNFKDKVLTFAMDAALSVGPLTLSLDGLSMGSPIDHFEPKFDLKGIGLDFKSGPLEIGGQFLRQTINGIDEYSGLAIIKSEELTLTAIGSYAELDGHPSLFIYAVLDYPIGGPSFFFVTGLAAGFGYNRRLIIPAVGKLADFPLISTASGNAQAPAIPGQDISTTVTDQLRTLSTYIPPSVGDYFLAVGIKFSSFKMIDSIAVLVVQFGKHDFEVDLLGMSTLIVPTQIPGQPPVTPIAEVQLAVKATFQPAEGFLGVQAELTDKSFILDRKCKLTGGFAFYSWFSGEHTGDFVLTLGGYHPDFKAPAHYPSVPRLGLTWQVTNELSIKGTLYYALTSTALMAGGSFSATYTDGGLQAWFNASADFLFAWKPYHYDARISVNMGVKYSFLSIDVGADIHLWGPDFAGTAHINLSIISFDVNFGSNSPPIALPIGWDEFKASFLAKDDTGQYQVCSVKAEQGLAKEIEVDIEGGKKQKRWVINPKEFSITTDSVIPSNQPAHDVMPGNKNFGVAPMAKQATEVTATQRVVITKRSPTDKGESTETEVQDVEFTFLPVTKSVPAALWGESFSPNLNGERLVKDVLSGYQIVPKTGLVPSESHLIEKKELQYDTWELTDCFGWEEYRPESVALSQSEREDQVSSSINATNTSAKRRQLLSSILGDDLESEDLNEFKISDFNVAPQIEKSELLGEPE